MPRRVRKSAGQLHAPYVVDVYGYGKGVSSHDARSLTEAMRIAKRENGSGPTVVWKHVSSGNYRPHRTIVEGEVMVARPSQRERAT